jgi:hypothetical protein
MPGRFVLDGLRMTRPQSPSSRTYTPAERRLLGEWLAQYHAEDVVVTHAYLGPLNSPLLNTSLTPQEINMLGLRRRWADAVILYDDHVEIVEAKVVSDPFVIAQIELYLSLFNQTIEFKNYWGKPLTGIIVAAVLDPSISALIRSKGLKEITYKPAWVDEYLSGKAQRKQKSLGVPIP